MKTKELIKPLIIVLTTALFFIVSVVSAFLLFEKDETDVTEVGFVKVSAEIFLDDILYEEIDAGSDIDVIEINLSDRNDDLFFEKLSIDIIVLSNVDTYLRVAIYEQFTLTYITGGVVNKIAVTKDEYAPFVFNNSFYNNRIEDDYFYYVNKVQRINENEGLRIPFIYKHPENEYVLHDSKYTIQLAIKVEAVQAVGGPLYNWGLTNPPWANKAGYENEDTIW